MAFPILLSKPRRFVPLHPEPVCAIAGVLPSDIPMAEAINATVAEPWTKERIAAAVHNREDTSVSGAFLGDASGPLVGFCVYQMRTNVVDLLHLAVSREFRRRGVGSQLFAELDEILSIHRRPRLTCRVSERDEETLGFLVSRGMTGLSVIRDGVKVGTDSIVLEYWGRDVPSVAISNRPEEMP